jgi:protein-disulfide isomerase
MGLNQRKEFYALLRKRWGRWLAAGAPLLLLSAAMTAAQARKAAGQDAVRNEILHYVRERFSIPANVTLSLAPFRNSEFPGFYQTTVLVNGGKQQQVAYVSKDGKYLVFGNIYQLGSDPRAQVEREIDLHDQASVGPPNAPVTIVEYSDLECPMCARMHEFMAKQLLPKYGNKIRIIFKEFPLVQIHQWALTGAIADQCVYQINPSDVLPFRTLTFENQGLINATNARALLLDFAQRVGVDRLKLATCIDSKATLPRVEASMREGQRLGVNSTPTLFVNGQMVVGLPPAEQFYAIVDHALAARR